MKYIIHIFIVLTVYFSWNRQCYAQNYQPQQIATPEVAGMLKFSDIPVSYYTGVPNITVPVYNREVSGMSIDVSLKYHSNGIKVSEEASTVGLGWLLSAGGQVTTIVKGERDCQLSSSCRDFDPTYIADLIAYTPTVDDSTLINSCISAQNCLGGVPGNFQSGCPDLDTNGEMPNGTLVESMKDTEADLHYFNFLGYSGKFINIEGNWVVLDGQKFKIERLYGGGWKIISPDGVTATFSTSEYTTTAGDITSETYHLTSLQTATGATVSFKYISKSRSEISVLLSQEYEVECNGCGTCNPIVDRTGGITHTNQHYLDSIVFNDGYLKFSYGERSDIIDGLKLNNIGLYTKNNAEVWIKNIEHDYFKSTDIDYGGHVSDTAVFKKDIWRLKLNGIYTSKNALKSEHYKFFYNENKLPHKKSYRQDYWGYYNGARNESLLPKISGVDCPSNTGCGDRTVNHTFSDAWMLNKIIYPTGGERLFQFEGNTYVESSGPGLRIRQITDVENEVIKTKIFEYINPELSSPPFGGYYETQVLEGVAGNGDPCQVSCTKKVLTSNCIAPIIMTSAGVDVGYERITESNYDSNMQLHSKATYTYFNVRLHLGNGYMSGVPYYQNPLNGTLLKKEISSDGKTILNTYVPEKLTKNIYWMAVKKLGSTTECGEIYGGDEYRRLFYYLYPVEVYENVLTSEESTIDGITSKTTYHYDDDYTLKPTRIEKEVSHGIDVTDIRYTGSYFKGVGQSYSGFAYVLSLMMEKNMVNTPIEVTNLRNSKIVSSGLNTYKTEYWGRIRPDKFYSLEIEAPISIPSQGLSYTDLDITTNKIEFNQSEGYNQESEFTKFNYNGNLLQMKSRDGVITSYLWDATGTYPMAKVIGATYAQINTPVFEEDASYSSSLLYIRLKSLVAGAIITTYSYKPLIGMSSMTDPNGITTYYEYDAFGRLEFVKDHHGNILKKYDYHYKTSNL